MVVNRTNLFTETRDVFKRILHDNIVDPKKGTSKSSRRWIYREDPDTTSRDFKGYPIIILESADTEDDPQDLCGDISDTEVSFEIRIDVEFNDSKARVDEISNQVYDYLRRLSTQKELSKQNIHDLSIQNAGFDNPDRDGKRLSSRSFVISVNSTILG